MYIEDSTKETGVPDLNHERLQKDIVRMRDQCRLTISTTN